MSVCVVVPHYNHIAQFRAFLPRLLEPGLPLVLVDDASDQLVFNELTLLVKQMAPDTTLLRHNANRGKGGAVSSGLKAARQAGFSHALQIDADGQHDVSQLPEFLDASEADPAAMICGQPVFDKDVSKLRYYARFITLGFSHMESLCTDIRDAMCGFRLYPLETVVPILERHRLGERMVRAG